MAKRHFSNAQLESILEVTHVTIEVQKRTENHAFYEALERATARAKANQEAFESIRKQAQRDAEITSRMAELEAKIAELNEELHPTQRTRTTVKKYVRVSKNKNDRFLEIKETNTIQKLIPFLIGTDTRVSWDYAEWCPDRVEYRWV